MGNKEPCMTSLYELLDRFRTTAKTEREKGTYFELLVEAYLKNGGLAGIHVKNSQICTRFCFCGWFLLFFGRLPRCDDHLQRLDSSLELGSFRLRSTPQVSLLLSIGLSLRKHGAQPFAFAHFLFKSGFQLFVIACRGLQRLCFMLQALLLVLQLAASLVQLRRLRGQSRIVPVEAQ